MKKVNLNKRSSQKGFTLVELAVVMIIVGLLIGGILKGQQLITNAQVASTITQIKGIDTAVSTFRDSYRALPGDMSGASTRLPNCTSAPCSTGGDGNGRLNNTPTANPAAGDEGVIMFANLAAADLLSGIDGSTTIQWGSALPAASSGGGFYAGYHASGPLGANAAPVGGHYLSLQADPAGPSGTGFGALDANQAQRIDNKMDDGATTTGSVFPADAGNGCGQVVSSAPNGLYDTVTNAKACDLFIRMQG